MGCFCTVWYDIPQQRKQTKTVSHNIPQTFVNSMGLKWMLTI